MKPILSSFDYVIVGVCETSNINLKKLNEDIKQYNIPLEILFEIGYDEEDQVKYNHLGIERNDLTDLKGELDGFVNGVVFKTIGKYDFYLANIFTSGIIEIISNLAPDSLEIIENINVYEMNDKKKCLYIQLQST